MTESMKPWDQEHCSCGHLRGQHGDRMGGLSRGHGGCRAPGCDCEQFTWVPSPAPETPAPQVRPCKVCKGTGKDADKTVKACYACGGTGTFPAPDVHAILDAILTKRGTKKLRSSRPDSKLGDRAYYVWRMARFHGGADVTLPMSASFLVHGDPWVDVLDVISEKVAARAFGTDMAGALRWGRALGYVQEREVPEGLPASAYQGGPAGTEIGGPEDSPEYHLDKTEVETEGEAEVEVPACPACGGPGVPLGSLGRFEWYRCRSCGMDFHKE